MNLDSGESSSQNEQFPDVIKEQQQRARQKRRDISNLKRSKISTLSSEDDDHAISSTDCFVEQKQLTTNDGPFPSDSSSVSTTTTIKAKFLNRYEPEMPMSKEGEIQWRREARKQRNRASAAASRDRTKTRIQELEGQVDEWKQKYLGLIQRLQFLEQATGTSSSSSSSSHEGNLMESLENRFSIGRVSPIQPSFSNHQHTFHQRSSPLPPMVLTDVSRVQGIPLLLAATQTVSSHPSSPTNNRSTSTICLPTHSDSTSSAFTQPQLHLISDNSSRQASSLKFS